MPVLEEFWPEKADGFGNLSEFIKNSAAICSSDKILPGKVDNQFQFAVLYYCLFPFFFWPEFHSKEQLALPIDSSIKNKVDCRLDSKKNWATVKFKYCEKATKIWKKIFQFYLTLIVNSKKFKRFLQNFVAFSEYLNFTDLEAWLKCLARKKVKVS